MTTLFISDLHLQSSRPDITAAFKRFINSSTQQVSALYILGDLFELWIGDDDHNPYHSDIIKLLRQLSDKGVRLYFMHGNRDFLIAKRFCAAAGMTQIKEPYIFDLYGKKTLLLHGDILCTQDKAYQRFRRFSRNSLVRFCFLRSSLTKRRDWAARARQKSHEHQAKQVQTIMDISPSEIPRLAKKYQVDQIIHGHTHRPSIHLLKAGEQWLRHIVLSDWEPDGNVLICRDGHYQLVPL